MSLPIQNRLHRAFRPYFTELLATNKELEARGLTFDYEDIRSYDQMVNEFRPSTLKVPMPSDIDLYNLWLDPIIMSVVSGFMGFYPELKEAYIRRNFPSKYPVMNHYWHRDTNHDTYLLKAFLFFTDYIRTGAHHCSKGLSKRPRFQTKRYYSDEEIFRVWPGAVDRLMTSIVKYTVIIEDTRGLNWGSLKLDTATQDLRHSCHQTFFSNKSRCIVSQATFLMNLALYKNVLCQKRT